MNNILSIIYLTLSFLILAILSIIDNAKSYQDLLEKPKNYSFGMENINLIDMNHPLVKIMDAYCKNNNIYKNGAIVSLSGGVDSMVVLAILIKLATIHNFSIYTCSINYSQRTEQDLEFEFLKKYCENHNVIFYLKEIKGYSRKKETSGPRNEFEEESRKVRFDLYQDVIQKHGCNGIFVGHHKDDIIENIFTNSMKGGNLLDLEVMKMKSTIHCVNIYRPLLDYHKDIIYKFAHEYNIPYFLDTTPKWSRRGKMRNEIFPLLDSVFTKSWRLKLKDLGNQSNQWRLYIDNYVIEPWIEEIYFGKYGFILPVKDQPKLIYSNLLTYAMHKIGKHMLKNSSIEKILENKSYGNKFIPLDSGFVCYVLKNSIVIFDQNAIQQRINDSSNLHEKIDNNFNNFVDGNISYKNPKDVLNNYTINAKRYNEMNMTDLPLNLMKHFTFNLI